MEVINADTGAAVMREGESATAFENDPTIDPAKFDVLEGRELLYYSARVVTFLVHEMKRDNEDNNREWLEDTPHKDVSPLRWCIEQHDRDGALTWLKATSFLEQHGPRPPWGAKADKNALHHRDLYRMSKDDDHALFRAILQVHSESLVLPSPFTSIPTDPRIKDNPLYTNEDCKRQMYPMHLALMHSMPSDILLEMIRLKPELASLPNMDGDYPLHYAAQMADASVVAALHDAYPPAASLPDTRYGCLPLHLACAEDEFPRDEVVLFLIRAYIVGATEPDKEGDLPFHRACRISHCLSQDTMHRLLEAYPEVLYCRNKRRQLPLHTLCGNMGMGSSVAPLAILRTMIDIHPQAVREYTEYGYLAIHQIIHRMQELDYLSPDIEKCMEILLEALPRDFNLNYRDGKSPLFLMAGACQYDFPLELWKAIIEPHPEVLLHRISDPFEEHKHTYDKDGYTVLALILAKEDASNNIMRNDLTEGYVLKRTYEVLCDRRQAFRRRGRLEPSNNGMLENFNTQYTAAEPIRTTGLHRLFHCMHLIRLDGKDEGTLRDIASNVGKNTTLLECLCIKDSHGNTPLHLLWNADSCHRSTSTTTASSGDRSKIRHFTRFQVVCKVLQDAGLSGEEMNVLFRVANNRGKYPWEMAFKYSSASQIGEELTSGCGCDKADVMTLLVGCPESASKAMPRINMFPFVYAAMAPKSDLSATFTLM
jgi:hypothetical protein